MGYFFGIVWCILFGGLGLYLIHERKKYSDYSSFTATVKSVKSVKGRHQALLHSKIQTIGDFIIEFQDLGDFNSGDRVECMWDGKNPATAQEDLRDNQKIGIIFSFSAVALMVVIILVTLIV